MKPDPWLDEIKRNEPVGRELRIYHCIKIILIYLGVYVLIQGSRIVVHQQYPSQVFVNYAAAKAPLVHLPPVRLCPLGNFWHTLTLVGNPWPIFRYPDVLFTSRSYITKTATEDSSSGGNYADHFPRPISFSSVSYLLHTFPSCVVEALSNNPASLEGMCSSQDLGQKLL